MTGYKELKVYQKSYETALDAYALTKGLPKEEQYGLKSQIRSAAVSIPLNIAEGFGKIGGKKETIRFLSMARGSCCEMEVLLNFMYDLGYTQQEVFEQKMREYEEIGKMLTGLIQKLSE